jgi:hypothetical protein
VSKPEEYMTKINLIAILILLSLLPSTVLSQSKFGYDVEIGGYFATNEKLPYWMQANQFGVPPDSPNTALLTQHFYSKPDSVKKFFDYDYGLELNVLNGQQTTIRLTEAYIRPKFGAFHLLVGRKKQVHGIGDSTLSSGSMTWSGNAQPVPEVQIGISEYQKLLFNWFSFKGHISHGWFQEQTFVEDYFLHQKSLYFRIGKPNGKVKLHGGILHSVQWGGTPKYETNENDGKTVNGKFPSDWFTFKQVFFPRAAIVDTTLGYSNFEVENRFGAHLGQVDFAAEVNTNSLTILGYRQIPIETGRTIGSLSNLDDGVYGLSFKGKKEESFFQKLVVEYLFTMNQHSYQGLLARLLDIPPKNYMNDAFLFNHQQYFDGWSYNGRTIGSPFLIPQSEIRTERKVDNDFVFVNNNRIRAFYLGFNGKINEVSLTLRTSFSKNFGAITLPTPPAAQNSYFFQASIPLKRIGGSFKTSIALDQGNLIYDNYGVNISFCKSW